MMAFIMEGVHIVSFFCHFFNIKDQSTFHLLILLFTDFSMVARIIAVPGVRPQKILYWHPLEGQRPLLRGILENADKLQCIFFKSKSKINA